MQDIDNKWFRVFASRLYAGRNGAQWGATPGGSSGVTGESIAFWQEFETQIRSLLSRKGTLTVNRLTGTVMVSDLPAKVELVSRFIALMREGMYRQVDIEVRIVEVTLSDNFALGLDWSRFQQVSGRDNAIAFNTRIASPQVVSALLSTMMVELPLSPPAPGAAGCGTG